MGLRLRGVYGGHSKIYPPDGKKNILAFVRVLAGSKVGRLGHINLDFVVSAIDASIAGRVEGRKGRGLRAARGDWLQSTSSISAMQVSFDDSMVRCGVYAVVDRAVNQGRVHMTRRFSTAELAKRDDNSTGYLAWEDVEELAQTTVTIAHELRHAEKASDYEIRCPCEDQGRWTLWNGWRNHAISGKHLRTVPIFFAPCR